MKKIANRSILIVIFVVAMIALLVLLATQATQPAATFDAGLAYDLVKYQIALGPRIPGSDGHTKIIDWMVSELKKYGWNVELQDTTRLGKPVRNVVARKGSGSPWVILGAHFDTRMYADQDTAPTKRTQPVPGADDGASGVAVLLEMARVMPTPRGQVWLVFFDSEDQGDFPGWDWILGSRAFADSLSGKPDAVVVVDMVGDANLQIFREGSSSPNLVAQIWAAAEKSGHSDVFINQVKYRMIDDHTPFLEKGIQAADLIDFDYPYWHTTADTPDKVSGASLKAVGDSLLTWLSTR